MTIKIGGFAAVVIAITVCATVERIVATVCSKKKSDDATPAVVPTAQARYWDEFNRLYHELTESKPVDWRMLRFSMQEALVNHLLAVQLSATSVDELAEFENLLEDKWKRLLEDKV